jgi:hypothetical protein
MTQLLEKAYQRIAQLPEPEQDKIASLILEELDSEELWSQKFTSSADVLSRLGQKALADHRAGKTQPLEPDTL